MPDSFELEGAESGPLKGLTFAAKDLYDVRPNASMKNFAALQVAPLWRTCSAHLRPVLECR